MSFKGICERCDRQRELPQSGPRVCAMCERVIAPHRSQLEEQKEKAKEAKAREAEKAKKYGA